MSAMNDFPRSLFVEVTTRCNLACPMCVKNSPDWLGGEGHMPWEVFQRLESALPQAGAVVLNGIGESLLHPRLPDMVAFVKARQPEDGWCGLQTNGLLLDDALAGALVGAGLDVACLSVDGQGASLGHGHGQEHVAVQALDRLRLAARTRGRKLRLGLEFVLMRSNAGELPGLVDWAAGAGVDFLLVTHMLPTTPEQAGESLFQSSSGAALALYASYRERIGALGLGMEELTRASMRFRRNAADEALLALAGEMHAAAREKDIWLNLDRLSRVDFAQLEELGRLFEVSRQRARAAGLDLRLPALSAPPRPDQRTCAFMERQAAFIDWQGNVAPCHFLWHGYGCSLYGERKQIRPMAFGNIRAADLAEAWDEPEYRAFREHAQAKGYASCGDCSFALCTEASGAAFEQDCLGTPVPCGHCPWAVGQLMCLGGEPSAA